MRNDGLTGLCDDEDVVAPSEGILEVGGGSQVNVGIGAVGLTGGGTVKVPLLELAEGGDGTGERLVAGLRLSQTIKHFSWSRKSDSRTVVLERSPPAASIQMYSAMMEGPWSNSKY